MSPATTRTPGEKAARVLQLQKGRTGSDDEREIEEIFLATAGTELTELKDRIDHGDDHYDLQQLIYHDLDNERIRTSIVDHIRAQSGRLRSSVGRVGLKVVSDIDDTIYPSYADKRAWKLEDREHRKGRPYPGVVQFYQALAGVPGPGTSNIVLISARPYDRLGLLERHGTGRLLEMDFPSHTTLSGNLWTLVAGASDVLSRLFRRHERLDRLSVTEIGEKKLGNLLQWIGLMGEYDVVISGDRTQADHDFAHAAITHPTVGSRVLAGFIHDVGDRPKKEHERLHYNRTVLGHALDAHRLGLIGPTGLESVRDAVLAGRQGGAYPPELVRSVDEDLGRAKAALAGQP